MAILVFSILTAQPSSLLSCRILCIARKERSTSSGSLIILMKKKFYRLSVRRYSLTNIYAVVEREREREEKNFAESVVGLKLFEYDVSR